MTRIGFLHTAEVHAETFAQLLHQEDPSATAVHVVDPTLLTDAMDRGGVDENLMQRVAMRLGELEQQRVDLILCTCSTIGAEAEMVGSSQTVAVRRIDRAMADEAVRAGSRLAVVAAVESTLLPTRRLIDDAAENAGVPPTIHDVLVADAWSLFQAGDINGYLDRITDEITRVSPQFDVIVLAQASMAAVADRLTHLPCRVLASPALGVRAGLQEVQLQAS